MVIETSRLWPALGPLFLLLSLVCIQSGRAWVSGTQYFSDVEKETTNERVALKSIRFERMEGGGRMPLDDRRGEILEGRLLQRAVNEPDEQMGSPQTQYEREQRLREEYRRVIENVGSDKYEPIVVVVVNAGYLDFFVNLVISLEKFGYANRFIACAQDMRSYEFVEWLWPGQVVLDYSADASRHAGKVREYEIGTKGFYHISQRRMHILHLVLEQGYAALYNDLDMVWLKDPIPYLTMDEDEWDVLLADDARFMSMETRIVPAETGAFRFQQAGKSEQINLCSCLLYMRPTASSLRLLEEWTHMWESTPYGGLTNQSFLNIVVKRLWQDRTIRIGVVPQSMFPPGWLFWDDKWNAKNRQAVIIAHANWVSGGDAKRARLQSQGLWHVDRNETFLNLLRVKK